MTERPWAVTAVGLLMMAAGAFGMSLGFVNAKRVWPPEQDLIWVVIVDAIGIACGIFLLRGKNWARWLTVVWIGAHAVAISFYARKGALAHLVIFALIAYLLVLRADVREYFGAKNSGSAAE
jgi:hypothetical protein